MAIAVVASVLVLTVLSLLRVNVLLSLILATITAGVIAQNSMVDTVGMLVDGMAGGANTALSYILLGAFAVAISFTGITQLLVKSMTKVIKGKRSIMLLIIAAVASLSQNVVPVHIAFIPVLIPPLLALFDKMKIDRRGVATALTFGLKAPYITLPIGFGLIFQGIIQDGMESNGVAISLSEVTLAMIVPGIAMLVGLLIAVFFTYRKDRDYASIEAESVSAIDVSEESNKDVKFELKHGITVIAIIAALGIQLATESLVLGALTGLILMFLFIAVPFKEGERVMSQGITMMGMIAFIMMVASGFGNVLSETGSVEALVESTSGALSGSKAMVAFILLLVGLLVTMGIGTSFGTIPILAALFVPLASTAGFSPVAIAILIGTAGALGDAGSPASDSTLGPTAGLNVDGKHNHIWDTCVPTFVHYNIPLFLFGWIAAVIF
ncbi:Na+/H+ antiporter family protein [Salirhabdus salicampi]|uniref:Na+/H+ antiporter family protein n=1 Tax=Salirhabdus salicampi TaxID=476102 RepID=UPI0020C320FA|nr:Na+/H+ antiporter NhaC family protein [Salirhabdus salicampi]MCP8617917.1 TRAP transporter large permease subunit [Salirhabdus salicampi]